MTDYSMTIDGIGRTEGARLEVVNPASGQPFATVPDCSPQLLDEAMVAAGRAFRFWRIDEDARRDALRAVAKLLNAASAEIGAILTQEQGKPLQHATMEVAGAAMWFQYYADLDLTREVLQDDAQAFVEVVRRPMGVVAAIAPWNFPVLLACWKLAPALRAGNTVVVKPSPFTPVATLRMVEVINEALPPGVLNAVSGGDELGGWMTAHSMPRKVSFTGSVSTGKKVAMAAAADLKRVTLELGGNDPAIVLDDADPASVASKIFLSAFSNSGQTCVAVKRVYVPESLEADIVEAFAAQASSAVVGDGMDETTQLGPLTNKPQLERVSALVDDAIQRGATAAAGGAALDRPGFFYAPTILTGVSDGTPIVDEEQFGPALPVVTYRHLDEVVDRVNASMYGLGASVWTTDTSRGEEVARRLDAGTAWVNGHGALAPHLPFGGLKWSGVGVENGPWGYYSFTDIQVIHRAKA